MKYNIYCNSALYCLEALYRVVNATATPTNTVHDVFPPTYLPTTEYLPTYLPEYQSTA